MNTTLFDAEFPCIPTTAKASIDRTVGWECQSNFDSTSKHHMHILANESQITQQPSISHQSQLNPPRTRGDATRSVLEHYTINRGRVARLGSISDINLWRKKNKINKRFKNERSNEAKIVMLHHR